MADPNYVIVAGTDKTHRRRGKSPELVLHLYQSWTLDNGGKLFRQG